MKLIIGGLILSVSLLFMTALASASDTQPAEDTGKTLVNVDKHGLAIKGYDPVAYFTDHKPVEGDKAITSTYRGATYRFASQEHKTLFDKQPRKYAPQFGGFCAFAVSKGHTADSDPKAFMIVKGRLLLQYNKSVVSLFEKDTEGNLANADANWPKLVEKQGK